MILKNINKLLIVGLLLFSVGCEKPLDEETFSVFGPSNFYNTADDAESLLNSVYANAGGYRDIARDNLTLGEMTTDIMIERGGAINAQTQPIEDFEFPTNHPYFLNTWGRFYSAIYRANSVIDQVPGIDMDEERRAEIVAEARFLRAFSYYKLHDLFGPVPLVLTSNTSASDRPGKATEEEFNTFMNAELEKAGEVLPVTTPDYGRATKGAAFGLLSKFQLNNKNWQAAADNAKKVMDLGVYDLFTDSNRADLFAIDNQQDNEFIFVLPFPTMPTSGLGNTYLSHAAPPGYKFKFPPKANFAAQFKTRSEFLNLFEEGDQRLNSFLFQYENLAGETVELGQDDVRSFKYLEDPNGIGDVSGNDYPIIRYADILLTRAEALNELQGPNQESLDLINQVRMAAGLPNIELNNYSSKTALRDFIFDERGREFFTEALRRQDLIRQGTFIEKAVARGKPAVDYQVLFPIPQSEVDKNPNLEQNPGYN